METEFSSLEDAEEKRGSNSRWMSGALLVGLIAIVAATAFYGSVKTNFQLTILIGVGLLIAFCALVAAIHSVQIYRATKWLKNERDKT